jgi:sulfite reductase (NADPH) flavoprotein alpha-component
MSKTIAIYYGTVTGNSETLARDVLEKAQADGWEAQIYNLADITASDLTSHSPNALFIASTWGDGEPPTDAEAFFNDLRDSSVDLSGHKHAVFGLGDSSYEQFCKFATDLNTRLAELGSEEILDIVKSDVNFDLPFARWKPEVLATLNTILEIRAEFPK